MTNFKSGFVVEHKAHIEGEETHANKKGVSQIQAKISGFLEYLIFKYFMDQKPPLLLSLVHLRTTQFCTLAHVFFGLYLPLALPVLLTT